MNSIIKKLITNTIINKLLYLIFTILTTIVGFKTLFLILKIIEYISNKEDFNILKAGLNTLLYVTISIILIIIIITHLLSENDKVNTIRDSLGLNEEQFNEFLEKEFNEKDEK